MELMLLKLGLFLTLAHARNHQQARMFHYRRDVNNRNKYPKKTRCVRTTRASTPSLE